MARTSSRLQPLARAVLRTQSDERLVALARQGKEAAFEEIVRRYRPALVAFAAAYGPPDPEDVVQESLARSWKALRDSNTEMHLKAWLYTIVRNRALNAKRDSRSHEPLSEQIDGVRQPSEIVLTSEELDRTVAAVTALPEEQREALVRSALEGHTHEQIAASIGSTPGAVRQLIYRARLTVRHGVGAVIPLPLVGALADLGAGGAAAAGSGAAAGGAAAGMAGGGSLIAKAAVVATVGAIATGSGVAIHRATRDSADQESSRSTQPAEPGGATTAVRAAASTVAESDPGPSAGAGRAGDDTADHGGEDRRGEHGGRGSGSDGSGESGSSGSGSGETGEDDAGGEDSSGSDDSSGPGGGSSGSGESSDPEDSSGSNDSSGSSDSGSSGSSHSGSGSSGSGSDSSGSSDSDSSGSGDSGSSDSSGSGSGGGGSDADELDQELPAEAARPGAGDQEGDETPADPPPHDGPGTGPQEGPGHAGEHDCDGTECSVDDLAVDKVVEEASLRLTSDGLVFDEIQLG